MFMRVLSKRATLLQGIPSVCMRPPPLLDSSAAPQNRNTAAKELMHKLTTLKTEAKCSTDHSPQELLSLLHNVPTQSTVNTIRSLL